MKIVLIGNYPPDKQESMQRFADMLYKGFKEQKLDVEIWLPCIFFGKLAKSTISGYGKWIGYIDKWVLFPFILRWKAASSKYNRHNTRFHICDHSNAPYLGYLPKHVTSITCHDVLAIRGAMGYADAYCPASTFGKVLQQWILKNLLKAPRLAAVSQLTFSQLTDLAKNKGVVAIRLGWQVIHNAFNSAFYVMEEGERNALLQKAGIDIQVPFLLHVGSALPRKNRQMLVEMVAAAGDKWCGNIVFAGQLPDEGLIACAKEHHLMKKIVSVLKPDQLTVVALYNACAAFVFPSFSEGFGWPVIEAQACGSPVITSNIAPLPEVSGGAALHADPNNPESFANALVALQDNGIRKKVVAAGFENINRFVPDEMVRQYLKLMQVDVVNTIV